MSIALDSASNGTYNPSTQISWLHTCAGSNRVLIVYVVSVSTTVTGVTYDGVSMTEMTTTTVGSIRGKLFYLKNPSTGSNTVLVDSTGGGTLQGCSSSYTGVDYTNGVNSASSGTGSSISASITTTVDNCWLVSGCFIGSVNTINAGTNTTIRGSNTLSGSIAIGDTGADQTPPGSKSQAYTWSGSPQNTISLIALAPPFTINTSDTLSLTDTISNTISTDLYTVQEDTTNASDTDTLVTGRGVIDVADTITTTETSKVKHGLTNQSKISVDTTNQSKIQATVENQAKSETVWVNQDKI